MRNPKRRRLLTPPPDGHISLQQPANIASNSTTLVPSLEHAPKPSPQKKRRFHVSIRSGPSSNTLNQFKEYIPSKEPITLETPTAFPEPSGDFIGNDGETTELVLPPTNSDDSYELFADAVATEAIPFFQLASELYVVTGWDSRLSKRTNHWYHIQMDRTETRDPLPICYCPSAKAKGTCVHQRYLTEEGPLDNLTSDAPVEQVILFWRDAVENGWTNLFSVSIDSHPSTAKHRVVVTYVGADTGLGDWKCSRDGINQCGHITKCQLYLRQLFAENSGAVPDPDYGMAVTEQVCTKSLAKEKQCCISYLPIMASSWARISTDKLLYNEPPPIDKVPDLIALTREARCSCGHRFHQESETFERPCTVYTLLRPISTQIQLQKCPHCKSIRYPSRAIGPDCRQLGIFNYNNALLFSHDLLDEYTSSFTSSETPFGAWIKVVVRRYQRWSMPAKPSFVEESIFRMVWFGYTELLDFSNDMVCPQCGPTPEAVIWDGITLAYNKKQVLPTIYPPTSKHPNAIVRNHRYPRNQCFIEDRHMRKLLSSITSGPLSLHHILSPNSNTVVDVDIIDATIQKLHDMEEAIELADKKFNGLHNLLLSTYGSLQLKEKGEPAIEVRRFFAQISTHESCVQIINRPALNALKTFLDRPSYENIPSLASVPCLYHLAVHRWTQDKRFSSGLLDAFEWVMKRVSDVLHGSMSYDVLPVIDSSIVVDGGWKKSGCKYSMPQIRHRPQYPNIPSDVSMEPKERGGSCNKFYSEYGEKKLMGGIMAVWCTHSICYGFHFIPESEGRNDIFSALITRWPTAPKYVIYDFACQLAPYCRAREPEFFADTTFLIDDFHAMGHSQCSTAFFLKTYAQTRPVLGRINSSAAECGNGGLGKIRKSVRYMGQDRAILYTSVFFAIWNCLKILKM